MIKAQSQNHAQTKWVYIVQYPKSGNISEAREDGVCGVGWIAAGNLFIELSSCKHWGCKLGMV